MHPFFVDCDHLGSEFVCHARGSNVELERQMMCGLVWFEVDVESAPGWLCGSCVHGVHVGASGKAVSTGNHASCQRTRVVWCTDIKLGLERV